eukprot:jgi/Chlat1/1378/Chrsp119S01792
MFASPVLQAVMKKTGGLLWKKSPMARCRKANLRKRIDHVHEVQRVLAMAAKLEAQALQQQQQQQQQQAPASST